MKEQKYQFDFDDDYEENEEFDDSAIIEMGEIYLYAQYKILQGVYVPNFKRVKDVEKVYNVMKNIFAGKDVEVSYKVHKPQMEMGCVTLKAKVLDLDSDSLPVFFEAQQIADGFEISPFLTGTVEYNLTFWGLANKIGEIEDGK